MSKRSRSNRTLVMTDREAGGRPENDYMEKLMALQKAGAFPAGVLQQVVVVHKDDCPMFAGADCCCDPEIAFEPLVGDTVPTPPGETA